MEKKYNSAEQSDGWRRQSKTVSVSQKRRRRVQQGLTGQDGTKEAEKGPQQRRSKAQ